MNFDILGVNYNFKVYTEQLRGFVLCHMMKNSSKYMSSIFCKAICPCPYRGYTAVRVVVLSIENAVK